MTADREQMRKNAKEVISHGSFVHEDLPATVAEHCLALLDELEQAERNDSDEQRKRAERAEWEATERLAWEHKAEQAEQGEHENAEAAERERHLRLQAERERDEAQQFHAEEIERRLVAEARLAKADALAEAGKRMRVRISAIDGKEADFGRLQECADWDDALAAYEAER